jgi:hypothetical protein
VRRLAPVARAFGGVIFGGARSARDQFERDWTGVPGPAPQPSSRPQQQDIAAMVRRW